MACGVALDVGDVALVDAEYVAVERATDKLNLEQDGVVLRVPRDDAATVEEALVVEPGDAVASLRLHVALAFACEDGWSAALSRAVAARPSDAKGTGSSTSVHLSTCLRTFAYPASPCEMQSCSAYQAPSESMQVGAAIGQDFPGAGAVK